MNALSESYSESVSLLQSGKTREARDVFRNGFVVTVKKLYVEAGSIYPLRYDAASCWTAWTRRLYVLTRQSEDAFAKGDADAAAQLLPELRKHFCQLHQEVNLRRSGDAIFEFLDVVDQDETSVDTLKAAFEEVGAADLDAGARENEDAYKQAKTAWESQVQPFLGSSANLTAEQRAQLRAITLPFYKAFGLRFE